MTLFKYRNNNYFDENTIYIFYHNSIDRLLITKVHLYNGSYYTNEGLKFKCTSLKCIIANKYLYKIIIATIKNKQKKEIYIGEIIKFLPQTNSIGVKWKNNLLYYWQNINNKNIKII